MDKAIESICADALNRLLTRLGGVFEPKPTNQALEEEFGHKVYLPAALWRIQHVRSAHLWNAYFAGKPYRALERVTHEDHMVRRGVVPGEMPAEERLPGECRMFECTRVARRWTAMLYFWEYAHGSLETALGHVDLKARRPDILTTETLKKSVCEWLAEPPPCDDAQ